MQKNAEKLRTTSYMYSNSYITTTTTIILRPLTLALAGTSSYKLEDFDFVDAKVYCPHALADGKFMNKCL